MKEAEQEREEWIQPGDTDSALTVFERAALDVQVSTAKRYPRSVATFRSDLEAWSCELKEIAAECTYRLPRGNGIIGPSVRFAELAQQAYGNLIVDTRVLDDGIGANAQRVVVEGTCRDMERNTASRAQVTRSIRDKHGKKYAQHMIETTIAAASAVARRNAIFQVIPRALWFYIWERTKLVTVGEKMPHAERIKKCRDALKELKIDEKDVDAWLGKRLKDASVDDLVSVGIQVMSIKNGTLQAADAFPAAEADEPEERSERPSAKGANEALKSAAAPEVDPETGEEIPDHVGRAPKQGEFV